MNQPPKRPDLENASRTGLDHDDTCTTSSQLGEHALDAYNEIRTYIERAELLEVPVDELVRLLDFNDDRVQKIWNTLDRWADSTKASNQAKKIYDLILFPSNTLGQWKSNDRRPFQVQHQSIQEIADLSSCLLKLLRTDHGFVNEFLKKWDTVDSKKFVDFEDILKGSSKIRHFAITAFMRQMRIPKADRQLDELTLLLASLSKAAENYRPTEQELPEALIGAASQKKTERNFCIIRLHRFLEVTLGKPFYSLNANIMSVILNEEIKETFVEEVVFEARKRGEIPSPKSTKSPRP